MRTSIRILALHLLAVGLASVGCGSAEPSTMDSDEPVAELGSAFQNSLSFSGCGQAQINTIQAFANVLDARIYENGGESLRECLNDSFLSSSAGTEWGGKIATQFQRATTTSITCSSNLDSACGPTHDWWGCANVGINGEQVVLANQLINDPTVSLDEKAAVLAHELAHNYGHNHPNAADNDGEYDWTIPQRVRSCVRNHNHLPAGESRKEGMPGEAELGYIGRFGGTPFELAGVGSQFVSGFTTRANATVNQLKLRFSDADNVHTESALVGGAAGVTDRRNCPDGQVVVGMSGRAGATINRLIAHCAPRTNLNAVQPLASSGDDVGTPYTTMCPAGMAVRQVRGRAGSTIDQLRLVCNRPGKGTPDRRLISSLGSYSAYAVRGRQLLGSSSSTWLAGVTSSRIRMSVRYAWGSTSLASQVASTV